MIEPVKSNVGYPARGSEANHLWKAYTDERMGDQEVEEQSTQTLWSTQSVKTSQEKWFYESESQEDVVWLERNKRGAGVWSEVRGGT